MKKTVQILALLLVFVMLAAITACSETKQQSEESSPESTAIFAEDEETTAAVTVDPNYSYDLPELNFAEDEIKILAANRDASKDEFYADGITGNIISDAVYKRNSAVENKLNVTLNITLDPTASDYGCCNTIKNQVASGDEIYDLFTMVAYTPISYILEGDFRNLHNVPNLNLDKYYWVQGFNDIMDTGTKQYVCLGAYSISSIRMMNVIVYNKTLFETSGIEDIYQTVMDGKWTIEKQIDLITDTYSDLNGDGVHDAGDFYGFVGGGCVTADPYLVAFGSHFLSVDSTTGEYSFGYSSEKIVNAVNAFQKLVTDNPNTWSVGNTGSVDSAFTPDKMNIFADNRALMVGGTIYHIEAVLTPSEFTGEYGIAPQPKLNEDQENYYTYVQDQMTSMGVPSTVPDSRLAEIGAVMETISYESYQTVFPAYYETSLSYRFLQDYESKQMLDMIYSTISLEGAILYSPIFGMISTIRGLMRGDSGSPTSVLASQKNTWASKVKDLNAQLAALD